MIEESQTTLQDRIFERYSNLTSDLEKFRKKINEPLKQSFRINSLKGNKEKILLNLKKIEEFH